MERSGSMDMWSASLFNSPELHFEDYVSQFQTQIISIPNSYPCPENHPVGANAHSAQR